MSTVKIQKKPETVRFLGRDVSVEKALRGGGVAVTPGLWFELTEWTGDTVWSGEAYIDKEAGTPVREGKTPQEVARKVEHDVRKLLATLKKACGEE